MSAAEDEPATPDPQSQDELEATLTSLRQEVIRADNIMQGSCC